MKILMVEDNPKTRQMMKQMLVRRVSEIEKIIECEDGKEAIALYETHAPDWVLMDIDINTLDGLQASKAILGAHPDAKILIVTMYDEPEYRRIAEKMGVRDYVLKDDLSRVFDNIT